MDVLIKMYVPDISDSLTDCYVSMSITTNCHAYTSFDASSDDVEEPRSSDGGIINSAKEFDSSCVDGG